MARPEGRWLQSTPMEPDAPIDVSGVKAVLQQVSYEPTDNIFEVGEQLYALSEAEPSSGRQGVFNRSYAELTLKIGRSIHYGWKAENSHLPKFKEPEVVMHTAGIFAGYDFRANQQVVDYYEAETPEQRKTIYDSMEEHWRYMKFADVGLEYDHVIPLGPNPLLEAADPLQQMKIGMDNHINGVDLPESMLLSGAPKSYLREPNRWRGDEGGDYHRPINQMIKMTTLELAPLMVGDAGNNEKMVRLGVMPVPLIIAGFRRYIALPNYYKLKEAGDDEQEYRALASEMNHKARLMGKFFLEYGDMAISTFDFFTGGGPVWSRFRKEEEQRQKQRRPTDVDRNESGVA